MRRPQVVIVFTLVAGCRPVSPALEPKPEPAAEVPVATGPPEMHPISVVEQRTMSAIPHAFDPTGTFRVDDLCMVWDPAGDFRGELESSSCEAWTLVDSTVDGRRSASLDGPAVVVEGEGAAVRLECDACGPVRSLAWNPTGDQLALWREDAETMEIWSLETRERINDVPLGLGQAPLDVAFGWADTLWVVAQVPPNGACDDECEEFEFYRFELLHFERLDAPPRVEVVESESTGLAVTLDPRGQCLYTMEWEALARVATETRLVARALSGTCPAIAASSASEDAALNVDDVWWSDGPRAQLVSVMTGMGEDGDEGFERFGDLGDLEHVVAVAEFSEDGVKLWQETTPPVAHDASSWVQERDLLAARGGNPVSSVWRHCTSTRGDETGSAERCTVTRKLPRDCEFVDLSPDGQRILASCGTSSALTLQDDARWIELEASLGAKVVWGATWLVTVDEPSGVRWRDLAAPQSSRHFGAQEAWINTTLGPQHDRLLVSDESGVRMIDATTGRASRSISTTLARPQSAALSTSGERLAITDGRVVETLDLERGTSLARWESATAKLAWRQDDRMVFSGDTVDAPHEAWDPQTGEARPDALPDLGSQTLDPTWRFAVSTPHRITRLLDGQSLWFDAHGAMLDDGRYDGAPAALQAIKIRIGSDMLTSPLFSPDELPSILQRKGLASAFFGGHPIAPAPTAASSEQRDAWVSAGHVAAVAVDPPRSALQGTRPSKEHDAPEGSRRAARGRR